MLLVDVIDVIMYAAIYSLWIKTNQLATYLNTMYLSPI